MQFSIRIGSEYLKEIISEDGFAGNSQLSVNKTKGIITSKTEIAFSSLAVGNKVKEVIELMRFGDIKTNQITIQEVK